MAFASNPLSLSVPDREFESWLRDAGYLEILDQRTSDLHRLSPSYSAVAFSPPSDHHRSPNTADSAASTITGGLLLSLFSHVRTLVSLLTLNPFAKLTTDDFSGDTPSWTHRFIGSFSSYSFPASASQARLRVHENVKRYARNYASLFILFFACALYQMPLALVGLVSTLALWDAFKFCADSWGLDQRPLIRQSFVRVVQCGTVLILFFSNVQMALFCALSVCYGVMILHASCRKLTPASKPAQGRRS